MVYKYQRRSSTGLEALVFYAWSDSIDDASNESSAFSSDPQSDRGNSDCDIRDSFHGVITYSIPTPRLGTLGRAVLGGWSLDTIGTVQSAPPVDLKTGTFLITIREAAKVRPDVVRASLCSCMERSMQVARVRTCNVRHSTACFERKPSKTRTSLKKLTPWIWIDTIRLCPTPSIQVHRKMES